MIVGSIGTAAITTGQVNAPSSTITNMVGTNITTTNIIGSTGTFLTGITVGTVNIVSAGSFSTLSGGNVSVSGSIGSSIVSTSNLITTSATSSNISIVNNVFLGTTTQIINGIFTAANNVTTASNITGCIFPNSNFRSFVVYMSNSVKSTDTNYYSQYTIEGIQLDSGWVLSESVIGDSSIVNVTINTSGQLQYTSLNVSNWTSSTFKYYGLGMTI
jgi:hypothetical protein